MGYSDIYGFIHLLARLKVEKRFKEAPAVENDTVASHSFRLAIMAHICKPYVTGVDIDKAVRLALYHDLVEAVCGDTDHRLIHSGKVTQEEKARKEADAIEVVRQSLPEPLADEIAGHWEEYESMRTPEARYVKALDKIEGMITVTEHGVQAVIGASDMLGKYGDRYVKRFPELKGLHSIMKSDLKSIFIDAGLEWNASYDDY